MTYETYVFPNIRSGPGIVAATVIDDETADLITIESGTDTVVQKCGNDDCTAPDPTGDTYPIRLTKRPEVLDDDEHGITMVDVDVAILMDGLADVVWIDRNANGVLDAGEKLWFDTNNNGIVDFGEQFDPSTYEVIGGDVPSLRFLGNVIVTDTGPLTITRANGSELGSFFEEGFQVGQRITTSFSGSAVFTIVNKSNGVGVDPDPGVTDDRLIVSGVGLATGDTAGARISTVTRQALGRCRDGADARSRCVRHLGGLDAGAVDRRLVGRRLPRGPVGRNLRRQRQPRPLQDPGDPRYQPDLRQRTRASLHARHADAVGLLRGQPVRIRTVPSSRSPGSLPSPTSTTPTGIKQQTIKLVADVNFDVPIARDGAKVFPVTTHGFWKLQGPLAVEGGVTGADRSLELGLKLPGEADGPLFKIGTQPPESKQIDVLNLFNDGSKQNRSGTMTSTTLSGLGLPKDLDFGPVYSSGNPQTFGEPAIFPGGIGYGTVQFVDGTFTTNGAKSTIEVVNLMLGIGNDGLDIQGTIDPDVPVKLTGTVIIDRRRLRQGDRSHPTASRSTGRRKASSSASRSRSPASPASSGSVIGFSDDDLTDTTDNTRMHLEQVEGARRDPGDHRRRRLCDDQRRRLRTTIVGTADGGKLIRTDGGNWLPDWIRGRQAGPDRRHGRVLDDRRDVRRRCGRRRTTPDGLFETIVLGDGPVLTTNPVAAPRTVRTVARIVTAGDVPVDAAPWRSRSSVATTAATSPAPTV